MYRYFFVCFLLVLYAANSYGAGTVTDGNYSASAEWGSNAAQTFDFIVVGSGAAGSVLAARLSAQNNWTVLLLEAGGPSHSSLGGNDYVATNFVKNPTTGAVTRGRPWTRVDVPLFTNSLTDPTTPVYPEYNYLIPNADIAKTFGGSMCHNNMVWGHPTQYDIQQWNITGWSYNQFLPYILKSENYTNSGFVVDPTTLGTKGPIQIRKSAVVTNADLVFYNVCRSAGYPDQPNPQNGVDVSGVGYVAFNIGNNGTTIRQSSALAYVAPILGRTSLTIALYAQVSRVLFSTSCSFSAANGQPTATGVQFTINVNGRQVKQTAYVRKEVILAGGTLLTPKTLLLSGVGPRSTLTSFGITPVVYNENVGKRIRNQVAAVMIYTGVNVTFPNMFESGEQEVEYGTQGTGVYGTAAGMGATSVQFRTLPNLTDPDIVVYTQIGGPTVLAQGFAILVGAATPDYSYGNVTLNSTNPNDLPIFNPNFVLNNNDVNTLTRGIQKVRAIMNQPAAVSYFGQEIVPGPSASTTQQIQGYVQGGAFGVYHYAGSCKMGNNGDSLRVVNPQLQVIGTNNLRVIDASVIPAPVHNLIQATVVGIAEKGAAMIISSWSN